MMQFDGYMSEFASNAPQLSNFYYFVLSLLNEPQSIRPYQNESQLFVEHNNQLHDVRIEFVKVLAKQKWNKN